MPFLLYILNDAPPRLRRFRNQVPESVQQAAAPLLGQNILVQGMPGAGIRFAIVRFWITGLIKVKQKAHVMMTPILIVVFSSLRQKQTRPVGIFLSLTWNWKTNFALLVFEEGRGNAVFHGSFGGTLVVYFRSANKSHHVTSEVVFYLTRKQLLCGFGRMRSFFPV